MRKGRKSALTERDIQPENAKIRISMFIPISLQDAYKREAAKIGIGYQTLMQMKLKEGIGNPLEKRIEAIERKLKKHS